MYKDVAFLTQPEQVDQLKDVAMKGDNLPEFQDIF